MIDILIEYLLPLIGIVGTLWLMFRNVLSLIATYCYLGRTTTYRWLGKTFKLESEMDLYRATIWTMLTAIPLTISIMSLIYLANKYEIICGLLMIAVVIVGIYFNGIMIYKVACQPYHFKHQEEEEND